MGEYVVTGAEPGRVLLGRLQPATLEATILHSFLPRAGKPLAAPRCYGVLVIGPARSGKTTSLLLPAVTRWDGPVITTSIRTDVLRRSWEKREASGWRTLIYNPAGEDGIGSHTWSPLTPAMGENGWAGARRVASALIEAGGLAEEGKNRNEAFWDAAAVDYLGPLLLAAAKRGPSMEPVLRWLREGDSARAEVSSLLQSEPDALRIARSVWNLESERQRESIVLTARLCLTAYEDPNVMRTCQGTAPGELPDITPEAVLGTSSAAGPGSAPGRGATLYLVAPPSDWALFAPLFTALIRSLIDAAYRAAATAGGSLDPPLLIALDEAANITPLKELPDISSTSAGTGIQLITVLQSLGQAEYIWGEARTRTLIDNHSGARVIFGGAADVETLTWAQELCGKMEVEISATSGNRWFGGGQTSRQREERYKAPIAEIRQMEKGTALVIGGAKPAAAVSLREGTAI
jgi:type IV secretion system protein VirD4